MTEPEMTLVLSMNPFLDPDSDRCIQTCQSNPDPPCSSEERHAQEAPCRRAPDQVSMSRIAYFKRKFVDDDEEPPFSFRTYCQTVAPGLEERAHVLRVSLEKMRFIDDPEVFLRRSVLVNNLLRRLRAEILLQSADWCFPPNAALASAPCILPPSAGSAHQLLHRAVPARICLPPQAGPPLRKRFRMVRVGQGDFRPDCAQTCCCVYAAAAAGHYLHLPFSMYDAALSTCSSTPSTSLLQLAGHSKLGLTVAVDDEAEEDAEEEEEDNEEEEGEREALEDDEPRQERASAAVQDRLSHKSRTKTVPSHKDMRTDDSSMAETVEEEGEQEEEEEEEQVVGPCSCSSERDLHRFSFWHRRTHRQ
ncbi:SERTA domain-containing protein 4 isoform X4 [Girardinichthys multiradiatus]|uniref:SERTA domain-containing protein 4 isoform X4 n=3 Tax=Girardinichthys multiradiatus TaxID=208333 RepID=UPI001FAB8F4B|nr:SERTA domain-containing protein 4 isoform X4 [Girardinichthys multiradiatus]